jgi:hypothetical protein
VTAEGSSTRSYQWTQGYLRQRQWLHDRAFDLAETQACLDSRLVTAEPNDFDLGGNQACIDRIDALSNGGEQAGA